MKFAQFYLKHFVTAYQTFLAIFSRYFSSLFRSDTIRKKWETTPFSIWIWCFSRWRPRLVHHYAQFFTCNRFYLESGILSAYLRSCACNDLFCSINLFTPLTLKFKFQHPSIFVYFFHIWQVLHFWRENSK